MNAPRDPWDDPRVRAAMERLLARRRELLDGGATAVGWKLAFWAPAVRQKLGLSGPLVGFLTDATQIEPGGECAIAGWTAPKLEPEIAIHVGAGAAVTGLSAAIELADADRPPSEVESVLAGNIYHRRFVLGDGPSVARPAGPIAVAIERDGEPLAGTADAEAATGDLGELAAYVGRYLERFGAALGEGEVIISGSTVPLLDIAAGQTARSRVAGVGAVAVTIA
jgi:2-keto-4-pentenoate hydratase